MSGFHLQNPDGTQLEARWDGSDDPTRAVVFCHPHPLRGGSMRGPLMAAVTHALAGGGSAVLRFNFRGVGTSTGVHDYGVAELSDVDTAIAETKQRYPDVPYGIAGWSFGGLVALKWHALRRATFPYVGIAPPVSPALLEELPGPEDLQVASRTFVLGERDDVIDNAAVEAYAAAIGATIEVVPASGHFFYYREEQVGEIVAAALRS